MQFVCDFSGGDVARSGVAVVVRSVEWSLRMCSLVVKMEDALLASTDGAEDRVSR